ncbi:MAG: tetratricopeptide repeat protein [Candidatus Latescibacterota bacterium]
MKTHGIKTLIGLMLLLSSAVPATAQQEGGKTVADAKKHYNFAVQYKNSGNLEDARLQYEKAIALCDSIYQFHFSYADLLVKMEKPQAAKAALLKALVLNPKHFQTLALLAEGYRQAAQYDSALVMYERMYVIDPEHRELLASIAGYREYLGKNGEALTALDELIGKGDADYETLMKAAALAIKENAIGKARDYVIMALEKKAKDIEALKTAATLSLQLEDQDSAIMFFRQLCEIEAADAGTFGQLEKLYRTRGDIENLHWTLERHIKYEPEDTEVIGELAEILYTRGNIEEGIIHVKKGLTLAPHDGRLHILMGENYRRLNQNDKALAEFRIAMKDSAWSSSAQRLIWQIERPESASEKKEKDFFSRGKQ